MRDFLFFFAIQCFQYLIVTLSMRAVTVKSYIGVIVTDVLITANGYLLIKRVSDAKTKSAMVGYIVGGTTGSVIALWLSGMLAL